MTRCKVKVVLGQKIRTWGGWYRHDTLIVNGKKLDGHIQIRRVPRRGRLPGRMEALTCAGNRCVLGNDFRWLARENGIVCADFEVV